MACNVCPIGLKPYRWVRFEVKGDPIPLYHTHEKPHALALLPFGDQLLEALHWTLGFWWGEARDYFQRAVLMGKSWHITEPVVPLQGLGRSAGSNEKGEKDWERIKESGPQHTHSHAGLESKSLLFPSANNSQCCPGLSPTLEAHWSV